MNELKIVEPEIQDLQVSSGDIVAHASMLTITNNETFAQGGELLMDIKRFSKTVEARFKEPVDLAFKAHRSMTALRDSVLAPFKQAELTIKRKIGEYQMEIEKKRQEEAARLRKEAEAKAEAERLAKAESQMDKGDLKGCEQTLSAAPVMVVINPETKETPKVAGMTFRDDWKFEIENETLIPREYLMVDESKIRKVVKALGKATSIPGVRVWAEKNVVAGAFR